MNQPDELIGKTFGQYTVIAEIGRGGMATVYRAQQQSVNRVVALKVLPRNFLHDPSFYERFAREVAVISQLEHPHILPVHDYGQVNGLPYIVMRYLGGGSLENAIRRGLPQWTDLEKPLRQVCQALDYAHQKGIIHRDLKPGNILFDENGNAYLSDFGIARVMDSDLTGSALIGTPAYMSPEQAQSHPLDGRSDIYSLGVVVFEWITGRMPFRADTPVGLLLKQIQEPFPFPRAFRADIPPQIEAVIMRACAKNPSERFASAGDFFNAFSQALKGGNVSPSSVYPSYTPPPNPQPTPPYIQQPTPYNNPSPYYPQNAPMYGGYSQTPTPYPMPMPKRRNRGIISVLILLIIGVVGVGIFIVTRPSDTSSTTSLTSGTNSNTTGRQAPISVRVPEGYVLYQNQDVQMAIPEDWVDVTTSNFIDSTVESMRDLNPQLYNMMQMLKPQIEAGLFRIFALDVVTGVNVSVAVEQSLFASLNQVENAIRIQYQQLGVIINEVSLVQTPAGEALYIFVDFPIAQGLYTQSFAYTHLIGDRLYTVTFTQTPNSGNLEDTFQTMLNTFRITS